MTSCLIREGVPDNNGNPLPADLTTGSYEIRDLTNKGIGTLFEGKVIFDKTYGHVVYGCAACCGWANPGLWYNPIGVPFQGIADDGVLAWYPCESEYDDISANFYSNWSSGSTSIVTVDTYGTHTGVAVGSTTSQTHGYYQSNNSKNKCPNLYCTPSGGANTNPKILLGGSGGTDITNTTQNVVVGQQIILYGSYSLPSGATLTSQSWTIPGTSANPPTAIAGFAANFANTTSTGGPVFLTSQQLGAQSISYYWVAPISAGTTASSTNTVQFTLNYAVNGVAQPPVNASATFMVSGPTSIKVSVPSVGSIQFLDNGTTSAAIEFGDNSNTPGITFKASASPPPTNNSGQFNWAQIISNDSYGYTGTTPTSCNGPTGLDNSFPFALTSNAFTIVDGPGRPLLSADTEFTWAWNATMYFMWQPSIVGNSTIFVPLGSISWQFQADVTQNMPTQTWAVKSSTASPGTFQVGTTYPAWNSVVMNGNLGGCP